MSDFSKPPPPLPLSIHSFSLWASEGDVNQGNAPGSLASSTWPTANLAMYIPFSIPWPFPVRRVFWMNGSAAGGNVEVGVYSIGGTKLFSVSAAGSSSFNSAIQYASLANEFLLVPGRYYMACMVDNITANRISLLTITAIDGRLRGLLQQASASPLPNTITPAQYAQTLMPFCGIHRASSGY